MIHWVYKAFERVHLEHKDAIISCFKNVRLSLAVDGSEDHLLKIRDCYEPRAALALAWRIRLFVSSWPCFSFLPSLDLLS
jgi:hypothetical protein